MKVDPAGFQIYLLDILAYRPGHLRQERAQRSQPLSSRNFARLSTKQQAKVSSQTARDRVVERQRQRSWRSYPRRNAALKLDLLSKEC